MYYITAITELRLKIKLLLVATIFCIGCDHGFYFIKKQRRDCSMHCRKMTTHPLKLLSKLQHANKFKTLGKQGAYSFF